VKRAFISDVHGNLPALQATLSDIESQGIDYIAFLGDAVGYGPRPNECVALLAEAAAVSLMGNHDYAAIGSLSIDAFNGFAREAMLLTRATLTDETLATIAGYSQVHVDPPYHLVHSSPDEPLAWHYVISLHDAMEQFDHFQTPLCLVGHSHKPLLIVRRPSGSFSEREDMQLSMAADHRYLINVGSVGQPRDGNPDACYLVVDEEEQTVELRRVSYPVGDTQAAMEQLNMPAFLIERLAVGK
jgi:diadenosine tetraphosphatase ApaH/serine/threonine PP2A family protein phosphatase